MPVWTRWYERPVPASLLFEMLEARAVHEGWLRTIEPKDTIFPKLDYRVYRSDCEPSLAAEAPVEGT
jgi:hypothetical protein